MIDKKIFDTMPNGEQVNSFILKGSKITVEIIEYGAIIRSIVDNNDGTDFVLGYDDVEHYIGDTNYFGSAVGRHAGRINPTAITLGGKEYNIEQNDGENNLHGGSKGLSKNLFKGEIVEDKLVMTVEANHLEDEFPGNLSVQITYSIEDGDTLKIQYHAVSDMETVINLTNHSYFNIAGHNSGAIDKQEMWLDSSYYICNNEKSITEKMLPTKASGWDFTEKMSFKSAFESDNSQAKMYNGIDNPFLLNGIGFRKVAEITDPKSGHSLEVSTDQVAAVIYTANMVKKGNDYKNKAKYDVHSAFCFETQNIPNAMHMPWFKSSVYKAGEEYNTTTSFKFK